MDTMVRLRRRAAHLRALGPAGVLTVMRHRLFGHRSTFLAESASLFRGHGLEVGGPSAAFGAKGFAPVYLQAAALDNVNFSARTAWEGEIEAGQTFRFRDGAAPGRQFVHEAGALASIQDAAYDFVASSHMLEHSANPIKVLHEWKRVMKPGAALLLVLPHKDGTFDRFRQTTPLQHMVDDFRRETQEDDRTHIEEVLQKHDLSRDILQESPESFRRWVEGNPTNRGVHHHVFDSLSATSLVDHAGFEVLSVEPAALDSIFIFARKPQPGRAPDNSRFTGPGAQYLRDSPFRTDRLRVREIEGPSA